MYLFKLKNVFVSKSTLAGKALPLPWLMTDTITITDNHAFLIATASQDHTTTSVSRTNANIERCGTGTTYIVFIVPSCKLALYARNMKSNVVTSRVNKNVTHCLFMVKCHPFTFYGHISAPNFPSGQYPSKVRQNISNALQISDFLWPQYFSSNQLVFPKKMKGSTL